MKKLGIILSFLVFVTLFIIAGAKAETKEEQIQTISFAPITEKEETTEEELQILKRSFSNNKTYNNRKNETVNFELAETVVEETVTTTEETTTVIETTTTQVETTTTTVPPTTTIPPTTAAPTPASQPGPQYTHVGQYRITFYCPGSCCCGKWAGGGTASGVMPQANHTIACGEDIPFGTVIHIEGLGTYVCEDRGVPSGCIDIFVNSHAEIPSWGEAYLNTYIVSY